MANQVPKTLIVGVIATLVVLLIIYLFTQLPSGGEGGTIDVKTNTVVFNSADKCATCHRRVTPDIVNQFAMSTMAKKQELNVQIAMWLKNLIQWEKSTKDFLLQILQLQSNALNAIPPKPGNLIIAVTVHRHGWL